MNDSPVTIKSCVLTSTGLSIDRQLEVHDWIEMGQKLSKLAGSLNWWIGDWVNYGVMNYGDKGPMTLRAQQTFSIPAETCLHYAAVAASVPLFTRVKTLSWSHHREVMHFASSTQKSWLSKAEKFDWSVSELRQAIREALADRDAGDGKPFRPWFAEFARGVLSLNQHLNRSPLDQWPKEQREALKAELKPLVEMYQNL